VDGNPGPSSQILARNAKPDRIVPQILGIQPDDGILRSEWGRWHDVFERDLDDALEQVVPDEQSSGRRLVDRIDVEPFTPSRGG